MLCVYISDFKFVYLVNGKPVTSEVKEWLKISHLIADIFIFPEEKIVCHFSR